MLKMWDSIPKRWLNLAGVLTVAGLFGFGLYLQYVLRLQPCPLCMIQRFVFIAIGALFLIAALHNAKQIGSKIYSVLIALTAAWGIAVASRHIWIQHLPKDQVPGCGPGLDYMLKNFPISEVWQELVHGSGDCAEKSWTFLALGIPEWSLVWYVLLGVFAVLVGWKKR
ncbi:MAG: disulfide bond formation protein B [Gammaproteobacteria bacterium]|nr:disulfide bond formation protein B [Gammaproteobacteria bacterium]MBU1483017.1 disulfide bond formation protein B [Gammaproteobacteria bacterium]